MIKVDFTEDIKNIIKGIFKDHSVDFFDPDKCIQEQSKWVRQHLKRNPGKFSNYSSRQALIRQFMNLINNVVRIQKREVLLTPKVVKMLESSLYSLKLKKIIYEIKNGIDINKYLSRNIFRVYKEDQLLTTWGVHHLHVTSKKNVNDYFMNRSDHLLMVYFDDQKAYLLDVRKHLEKDNGNVNLVWTRSEIFELMVQSFPDLMSQFSLNGIFSEDKLSDSHLHKFRNAGITTAMSVDGVSYIDPGGGIATSGCSMKITQRVMEYSRMFREWEKLINQNYDEVFESFKAQGINSKTLNFGVMYNDQCFYVQEKNTGVQLQGLSESDYFKVNQSK